MTHYFRCLGFNSILHVRVNATHRKIPCCLRLFTGNNWLLCNPTHARAPWLVFLGLLPQGVGTPALEGRVLPVAAELTGWSLRHILSLSGSIVTAGLAWHLCPSGRMLCGAGLSVWLLLSSGGWLPDGVGIRLYPSLTHKVFSSVRFLANELAFYK